MGNIGQSGPESIRIDGLKIQDLPLGQGNEAKDGLSGFLKTDRETKENNIRANYPNQEADYVRSTIRDCEQNIVRIKAFKIGLKQQVTDYRNLLADCTFRDKEMEQYDNDNPDDADAMKALRLKYPPYDIDALKQQILQFEEGITRSDDVMEKDHNSITAFSQVLVLVEQRDREILRMK